MVYADAEAGLNHEDVSMLKVNELFNWLNAWEFMERCGFANADHDDVSGEGQE
jgi:N-acetylglutamate synthase-like GNAT family acetyltransferase